MVRFPYTAFPCLSLTSQANVPVSMSSVFKLDNMCVYITRKGLLRNSLKEYVMLFLDISMPSLNHLTEFTILPVVVQLIEDPDLLMVVNKNFEPNIKNNRV